MSFLGDTFGGWRAVAGVSCADRSGTFAIGTLHVVWGPELHGMLMRTILWATTIGWVQQQIGCGREEAGAVATAVADGDAMVD